ncbi:MAG: haloacid dehalogenase type II [Caldimonas sp.]
MNPPTPSTRAPQAVLFDAYGTLFDVYSVLALAEQLFPGHGERLSLVWRDKQIEYSRLVSMAGERRSFRALTLAGLRYAAARLGLELAADAETRLMAQYQQLAPFAENAGVLAELQHRGVPTGVLSNGDPDMLAELIGHAGFSAQLAPVLSVQETGRYKTDPAAYALGPAALGLRAGEILFVSSNCWDAIGATWYGYTTLWVNRAGLPLEPLETQPTRIGSSLRDVLDFF